MAKRARQEEELVGSTSERGEGSCAAASERGTTVVEGGHVTVGRPVHKGKAETREEGVPANVVVEGMSGNGPLLGSDGPSWL